MLVDHEMGVENLGHFRLVQRTEIIRGRKILLMNERLYFN